MEFWQGTCTSVVVGYSRMAKITLSLWGGLINMNWVTCQFWLPGAYNAAIGLGVVSELSA